MPTAIGTASGRLVLKSRWAVLAILTLMPTSREVMAAPPPIATERLADLPDTIGVAGPFVGVAGDALIVAGGTNFPNAPPWERGTKKWYDKAYVLTSADGDWHNGFRLPRALAYGVSITTDEGLLCIGGCNETGNVSDVFMLEWDGESLGHRPMPSLPTPASYSAGARVGSRIYIAGGQAGSDPTVGRSASHFWMLDLTDDSPRWKTLPTWPGPERFYAVAGTDGESFYLFSGIRQVRNEQGESALEYLTDAYRFDSTTENWSQLGDLPHANGAAASPAPFARNGLLLLGRGADGTGIELPLKDRPPFGREILRYDIAGGQFESWGTLPFGVAAVPSANWRGRTIIASGESQPGIRTPAVWSLELNSREAAAERKSP